jgi:CheY-like chemotaxis protein
MTSTADLTTPRQAVRVLIADDSRDAVLLLGILLRSEGYEVRLAQNGQDALDQAAEFRPHVALLDIEMPDYSGYQVAQELSRRHGADCPVLIAVTGHTADEDRRQAEISGFHHFIPKPYNHQAMLALLNSLRN